MNHARRPLKNQISADDLVARLLVLSKTEPLCLLDSCGVEHLQSHQLIGALRPLETYEISFKNPEETLRFLDEKLAVPDTFAIFTAAYDFGLKLEKIEPQKQKVSGEEPDIFLALYDALIFHDYRTGETFLYGNEKKFPLIEKLIRSAKTESENPISDRSEASKLSSNFTKAEYLEKIEEIKDFIRRGDTYQTNLTQQFTAELHENLTPQQIFQQLRTYHPAPFASFIQRKDSTVISASPERFFRLQKATKDSPVQISTSPIKGTRPRGLNAVEDARLKNELLSSDKDHAENVMIVDLLRNDLGRICEFGSVRVEKLCELEEHPSLFHLVSTISGELRPGIKFSEILRAVFPCGSITGAPKIRTMQIIEQLETVFRGLSMGAVGYSIKEPSRPFFETMDLSVAIRTMRIKNGVAVFNVGGGIVIDSDPEAEFQETLTKAKALLDSIHAKY